GRAPTSRDCPSRTPDCPSANPLELATGAPSIAPPRGVPSSRLHPEPASVVSSSAPPSRCTFSVTKTPALPPSKAVTNCVPGPRTTPSPAVQRSWLFVHFNQRAESDSRGESNRRGLNPSGETPPGSTLKAWTYTWSRGVQRN